MIITTPSSPSSSPSDQLWLPHVHLFSLAYFMHYFLFLKFISRSILVCGPWFYLWLSRAAQLPFCMFEVLAGFWIYRLIEQQVLCHLFSVWILHCRTLDSYTKKNHCLEYFGKNKSRHKSILAAASMWSSIMKLTMPCLCIECLSHW